MRSLMAFPGFAGVDEASQDHIVRERESEVSPNGLAQGKCLFARVEQHFFVGIGGEKLMELPLDLGAELLHVAIEPYQPKRSLELHRRSPSVVTYSITNDIVLTRNLSVKPLTRRREGCECVKPLGRPIITLPEGVEHEYAT